MSNKLILKLIESAFLKEVYVRLKLGTIFILILFFLTCKKSYGPCETDPNTYYYLDVSDKAKIPYKGDELLMFTNNYGDTAICIGEGVKQFFVTQSGFSYSCDRDYFMHYEGLKYVYKDLNNKLNFEINGYLGGDFDTHKSVKFYVEGIRKSIFHGNYDLMIPNRETILISSSNQQYFTIPVINLNKKTDTIYFNLKKGLIGIKTDTIQWRLYEYE